MGRTNLWKTILSELEFLHFNLTIKELYTVGTKWQHYNSQYFYVWGYLQNLNLMLYIVGSTKKISTHLVYSIPKLFCN